MKGNSSKNAVHSSKKHSGFTLVELVVVIAVLAILAGVGAVAYRGYIEYAKKGVDRQLVGEVKNAVSMEAQSDPTVLKLGVDDKAIPIGSIFISCPSKDSVDPSHTSFSADPTGILEKALVSSCGDNFESALQLKYDGWQSDGDAAMGFINENGERYLSAETVMKYLYDFADTFYSGIVLDYGKYTEDIFDSDSGRMFNFIVRCLNGSGGDAETGTVSDILKQAEKNGLKDIGRDNMKNATIWAVANYAKNHGDEMKENMKTQNPLDFDFDKVAKDLGGWQFSNFNHPSETQIDTMYSCLGQFASLSMLVAYLDNKNDKEGQLLNKFTEIMKTNKKGYGHNYLEQLVENIGNVKQMIQDEGLSTDAEQYFKGGGQASKDVDAFVDMASHLNDLQDDYNNKDTILDSTLFTNEEGGIIKELKKYTGETNGILITAYSDGTTVVSPADADPARKNSSGDVPAAEPAGDELANN